MMSPAALAAPRRRLRILRRPTEQIRPSTPRAQRRDCHGRLVAAVLALAGEGASMDDAGFRPWCSATFIGAQHRLTLRIGGKDARARTDRLARKLPEAELAIPGHIVADIAVDAVTPQEDGTVVMTLAALTIEDW